MAKKTSYRLMIAVMILIVTTLLAAYKPSQAADQGGLWITGDIHNHTWLTDGKHPETEVLTNAFEKYGLNFLVNSEHGGSFGNAPDGKAWDDSAIAGKVQILGDKTTIADASKVDHPAMWRWQSLRDFSYPLLFGGKNGLGEQLPGLQSKYPKQILMQGVEWNVPTHEHASVGIVNVTDGTPIANFEYIFDQNDKDKSLTSLTKQNSTAADAVAGCAYLAKTYPQTSYVVVNHPSRKQLFTAVDLRDMNNAAPDVCFGLEGFPGHQKETARGGYGTSFYTDKDNKNLDQAKTDLARTYGGADIMLAKVGGLMDSLWGEGRRFWVFVNSDFHSSADDADFWPGEYAKTYVNVAEATPAAIVNGMRAGDIFIVHGDLINALDFKAASGDTARTMGQELTAAKGSDVTVTIRFKSPDKNNNGDKPVVDHIDLIVGDVTAKIAPGDANYASNTNASTKVLKTFTSADWKLDADGYAAITFTLPKLDKNQYLRLRGTNLGMNVENQTKDGNPQNDDLLGKNDKAKAYADLWFYSNPIFIAVK